MITIQLIAQSKTKKEEQTRLITPYPGRNRNSSKERGGHPKGAKPIECCKGHLAASLGAELGLWLWLGLLLWLQLGLLLQMREMKPGRVLLLHCMVRIIPSLESNPRRIYWMMMRHRMGSRIMNMWMKMKKQRLKKIKW